jgi:hypothetical protein
VIALAASAALAGTAGEVRLAVVIASNHGLDGEQTLEFADRDATRVSDLLHSLGGYGPGDVWVVDEATVDAVFATLARVTVRAQEVATAGGSASLLVFYAGHAGPDGLHLGGEVLPLPDLKSAIRVVQAADRIVVLDACNAGSIARSRGATLLDVSDGPVGFQPPPDEAWLTSSGPEERSFEVEDRRGALFTHFFLSGARGAADADGDDKVTLGELYGFVQVHTAAAAADLGQLQQPRWAGSLGGFALTDLTASATGVRVVGPVQTALLVIDERAEEVVAEVPVGGGANLALPPGSYQVVATGSSGIALGRLQVPTDGWTLWSPAEKLDRVTAVRTRGGLYDATPWAVRAGYQLGLGATPGRFDTHGGYLELERALGRGHAIEVGFDGAFLPYDQSAWTGADALGAVRVGWTREVWGRAVVLAPGLAAVGGLVSERSARSPDPVWGRWYGSDVDRSEAIRPFGGLEGGVQVDVPVGEVELSSWWALALTAGRSDAGLTPGGVGRLGVEVPFR